MGNDDIYAQVELVRTEDVKVRRKLQFNAIKMHFK